MESPSREVVEPLLPPASPVGAVRLRPCRHLHLPERRFNNRDVDGLLAIGACDKNMPGAMIAIARLNIPAIFVYGGTIKPGHYQGEDLTIVSAFEALGQHCAHRITAQQLLEVERHACPGAGACGGMFTANTMSAAIEAMGLGLPYASTMAAEDPEPQGV